MGSSNPIKQASRYNAKFSGDVWRHTPDVKAMGKSLGVAAALNSEIDARIVGAQNTQEAMHPLMSAYRIAAKNGLRHMGAIIRNHSGPMQKTMLLAAEQGIIQPPTFTDAILRAMVLEVFGVTYP
jgi:hypothetical protein